MKRRLPPWRIERAMLLIPCPWCGERPELEFSYGGQASLVRPAEPAALSDDEWGAFLYQRKNSRGMHGERWRHVHGCGRFFNTWRHTVADTFHGAWKPGETPLDPLP
jgi:sarcosine oxidase subunit delta